MALFCEPAHHRLGSTYLFPNSELCNFCKLQQNKPINTMQTIYRRATQGSILICLSDNTTFKIGALHTYRNTKSGHTLR